MNTIRGFNDYTGEEARKRTEIKKILIEIFERYGFEPAETPIIENEEFVVGENKTDEAVSDVYKLRDKGKRKLALRYEFTFQLKRLIKNRKLPYRKYQIGEVFRDEPVSSNRFRQFTQCDVDVVGSTIKDEAEILALTKEVLKKLGINNTIYVGNRKIIEGVIRDIFELEDKEQIRAMIIYLDKLDKKTMKEIKKDIMGDKSQFFKKIKLAQMKNIFTLLVSTLKNSSLEGLNDYYLGILKKRKKEKDYNGSLFKQGYDEVKDLIKYCKFYGVKVNFSGYLARGLSYYNGNVFEIKSTIKETICAGGGYRVNNINATGISFGLDRISKLFDIEIKNEDSLIVSLNQDREAIKLVKRLREQGQNTSIFYGKPSKALEYANSKKINKVIFVGKKEIETGKFKVKDMKTGNETYL